MAGARSRLTGFEPLRVPNVVQGDRVAVPGSPNRLSPSQLDVCIDPSSVLAAHFRPHENTAPWEAIELVALRDVLSAVHFAFPREEHENFVVRDRPQGKEATPR